MTTVINVLFFSATAAIFIWTGHSAEWAVDYATGLAQAAIWCTQASQVPFTSLWVSLKESTFREIPRTNLRTQPSSFLKYSSTYTNTQF